MKRKIPKRKSFHVRFCMLFNLMLLMQVLRISKKIKIIHKNKTLRCRKTMLNLVYIVKFDNHIMLHFYVLWSFTCVCYLTLQKTFTLPRKPTNRLLQQKQKPHNKINTPSTPSTPTTPSHMLKQKNQ